MEIVHAGGALACWQVGSVREAIAAVNAGCDFIVVQGVEAGGHVRGHISLMALLCEVLDIINVPVIAAGGIGNGRAMAAALAAGAHGVRVGTRFVGAVEAEAHPQYVNALIAADAQDTIYTEAFSNGWPNAPHRALRSCVKAAEASDEEMIGEAQALFTSDRRPVRRFAPMVISNRVTGTIEAMPQWAGESVGSVKKLQPAIEIVHELAESSEKLLKQWQ